MSPSFTVLEIAGHHRDQLSAQHLAHLRGEVTWVPASAGMTLDFEPLGEHQSSAGVEEARAVGGWTNDPHLAR